jgi:hypothetical protein
LAGCAADVAAAHLPSRDVFGHARFACGGTMAAKPNAGCLGWLVAGGLLLALVGQCTDDPSSSSQNATGGSLPQSSVSDPPAIAYRRYVRPQSANCRSEPSVSSATVEKLTRNDFVGVIRADRGWSLMDRSEDCWVRDDLLSPGLIVETAPVRRFADTSGGSSGRASSRSGGSTYYRNCAAARAAGAAPVLRGEPGYSRRLDRDGDGVGCE